MNEERDHSEKGVEPEGDELGEEELDEVHGGTQTPQRDSDATQSLVAHELTHLRKKKKR